MGWLWLDIQSSSHSRTEVCKLKKKKKIINCVHPFGGKFYWPGKIAQNCRSGAPGSTNFNMSFGLEPMKRMVQSMSAQQKRLLAPTPVSGSVSEWVGQWLIVSVLEIAIASLSFASLFCCVGRTESIVPWHSPWHRAPICDRACICDLPSIAQFTRTISSIII